MRPAQVTIRVVLNEKRTVRQPVPEADERSRPTSLARENAARKAAECPLEFVLPTISPLPLFAGPRHRLLHYAAELELQTGNQQAIEETHPLALPLKGARPPGFPMPQGTDLQLSM